MHLLASRRHGTLYLGATNDRVRRVHEHKSRSIPSFSARYGVDRLVWFETYDFEEQNPKWRNLYITLIK
jgi:putative endonuclease